MRHLPFPLTTPAKLTALSLVAAVLLSFAAPACAQQIDTTNVRVIDYGADMCGFVHNPYRGQGSAQSRIEPFMDKDGNGSLENDTVSGWQFSLTEPLNFPYAPYYDRRQKNARLYGGLTLYAVGNPNRIVSEGMMNANHESRDDFNFMGLGPNKPIVPGELTEAYAMWFWQKPDFLNDGADHRVTFDDSSLLAVHVSRYWGGLEAGRWMVRDGDTFYVSQKTFDNRIELIDAAVAKEKYKGESPMTRRSYILKPGTSKWAVYRPTEATADKHAVIDFDAATADFQPHEFSDVTAAGFIVTRSLRETTRAVAGRLSPHQALAMKWYAFRCDAVVHRPQQDGYVVPMAAPHGGVVLSKLPVSFAQWEFIRRIGVTNQYCQGLGKLGYDLRCDGAMGDMAVDGQPHTPADPVGRITWLDAAAWCNILSEYEGREPAYYADAECKQVLRRVLDRTVREAWGKCPKVYWKQSANGFRLPLRSEKPGDDVFCWEGPSQGAKLRIARNADVPADAKVVSHQPEWVDMAEAGADVAALAEQAKREAAGLKLVRLPVGMAADADRDATRVFAANRIASKAKNEHFRGDISDAEFERIMRENAPPDMSARKPYDLAVGATEVPYHTWAAVLRWAQCKGYEFNYLGDMGSMRVPIDPSHRFTPDEPVTNITWHDALVWCNALSEVTGRRSVYYLDPELTTPYRRAIPFRLDSFIKAGYPLMPVNVREAIGRSTYNKREPDTNSATLIYLDASADGYRLPYIEEFARLVHPESHHKPGMLDGQTFAPASGAHCTRAVDAGKPDAQGLYELNGNVFEWSWSPQESYLDVMGKYPLNGMGCFAMTAEQTAANRHEYRDAVYNTRPYFGFRVVRRP